MDKKSQLRTYFPLLIAFAVVVLIQSSITARATFVDVSIGQAFSGADAQDADDQWTIVDATTCLTNDVTGENCVNIDAVGGNNNDFQMKITKNTDATTLSKLEIRLFTNSNAGNDDVTIQAYDTESTITTTNAVTLTLVQGSFTTADLTGMISNFDANGVNWSVRVIAVGNGNDQIGEVDVQETVASGDTCSPDSPLTADHIFLATDGCVLESVLDAAGNNVQCSTGDGNLTIRGSGSIDNYNEFRIDTGCTFLCESAGGCLR